MSYLDTLLTVVRFTNYTCIIFGFNCMLIYVFIVMPFKNGLIRQKLKKSWGCAVSRWLTKYVQ